MPWPSEASLIAKSIAYAGGGSATPLGWLTPGKTIPANECWNDGIGYTSGIETSNLELISVTTSDGGTGYYYARRERSVSSSCPPGYDPQGQVCTPSQTKPVNPHKNNSLAPVGGCNGTNPIHAALGVKHQQEDDYQAGGAATLRFSRFYSSATNTRTGIGHGDSLWEDSNLGSHWRHNYSRHIDLASGTAITTATVFRANGDRYYFTLTAGNWVADADINGKLVQLPKNSGWRYTSEDNEIEVYNANGLLVSISEADGHWQKLAYSTSATATTVAPQPGLLVKVTDDTGRTLKFTYDANARIKQLTAAGEVYKYAYDTNNNLISVTYPDATTKTTDNPVKTYLYTDARFPNALTGIQDENLKQFATWTYDTDGHAISSEHAGGVSKATLSFNAIGTTKITTKINDTLESSQTYDFDTILGVKRLISQDQPAGSGCMASVSNLSYDGNGNVASRADFNGNKTCYAYDLSRNLETARLEGIAPGGSCPADIASYTPSDTTVDRKITTVWHPDWRLPVQLAEPLKITTWVYNGQPDPSNNNAVASCSPAKALLPDGKPIAVPCKVIEQATTDATGASGLSAVAIRKPRTWSYIYNANGQVLTADGPRTDVSDVTRYAYFANTNTTTASHHAGDLHTVTDAVGHVTTLSAYEANGRVRTMTAANGVVAKLAYWPRGWLKTLTQTAGTDVQTTQYTYTPYGALLTVIPPDGSVMTYGYDDAHRLTSITDNLGNKVTYTLDNAGNRTNEAVTDSTGDLTRYIDRVYDALNRLQTVTGAAQ